jgi:predicted DNA-binding transcriptional regulator YafY
VLVLSPCPHRAPRALFLAGLPAPAADLGLAEEVAAARLKLLAALPADLREEASRAAAVFHLDAPGWYRQPQDPPYLTVLMDAVVAQHAVDVGYRRWRAPQEVRRRRPYGLVLKSGVWYLVAGTAGSDDRNATYRIATYRVGQLRQVTVTAERFQRPAGFDLQAHWFAYLAGFEARRFTGSATIRISPQGRARLPDLADPTVTRAVDQTAGDPDADGWVEATIPDENLQHTRQELIRFGADVEVLTPPDLRQAMTATVRALARLYAVP